MSAYETALETVRRRRHADDPYLRVDLLKTLDERAVHPLVVGLDHVRLVDDADVPVAEDLRLGVHALDARDYRGCVRFSPPEPCGVHSSLHVRGEYVQLLQVLLEKLLHVAEEDRPAAPRLDGVGHDLRGAP